MASPALATKTVIDRIEIKPSGVILVRFAKQTLGEHGAVVSSAWHRTSFYPGADVDAQMGAVSAHLASMGYVGVADHSQIKACAATAWTPETLAAWERARRQSPKKEGETSEQAP